MPPTDAAPIADCPFCLADSALVACRRHDDEIQVLCHACGAAGPIEETQEAAVEAWNEGATRALDDPQQRPSPAPSSPE